MKTFKYLLLLINFVFCLTLLVNEVSAQDKVVVQTLKFSDINNRRYIWKFPDESEQFRKILMYVTLKCDRQTAHDIYDCGEWDYLAHSGTYLVRISNSKMDIKNKFIKK